MTIWRVTGVVTTTLKLLLPLGKILSTLINTTLIVRALTPPLVLDALDSLFTIEVTKLSSTF